MGPIRSPGARREVTAAVCSPVLGFGTGHALVAAESTLCLSDGQIPQGTLTEQQTSHVGFDVDTYTVRVPRLSQGVDCTEIPLRHLNAPTEVRTLKLSDGQRLHGYPTRLTDGLELRLLDRQPIFLPAALVGLGIVAAIGVATFAVPPM